MRESASMRRTLPWISLVIVVLVAGGLFWSRRRAPAPLPIAGSAGEATGPGTPTSAPPTHVAQPVAAEPLPPGPPPAAAGADAQGRVMAPPGPAARLPPGERLGDPLVPAAPADNRLGGGKGELFDPLNSGLRRGP